MPKNAVAINANPHTPITSEAARTFKNPMKNTAIQAIPAIARILAHPSMMAAKTANRLRPSVVSRLRESRLQSPPDKIRSIEDVRRPVCSRAPPPPALPQPPLALAEGPRDLRGLRQSLQTCAGPDSDSRDSPRLAEMAHFMKSHEKHHIFRYLTASRNPSFTVCSISPITKVSEQRKGGLRLVDFNHVASARYVRVSNVRHGRTGRCRHTVRA